MPRPRSDIAPRIVHAARARFLAQGVDGASLREIADDAGTSIGMVYYYHPTKDDLFLAVVEEVYVALLADLERALDAKTPVVERIRQLYQRLGRLSPDELLVLRIVVREMLVSPPRLQRLVQRFQRGHLPLILGLARDGFTSGVFDPALPLPVVLTAMMALGGPAQVILQNIPPGLPVPRSRGQPVADELLRILLRGVGAARATKRKRRAGQPPPAARSMRLPKQSRRDGT